MNTPFDERARRAHAQALDALSPRVQAQLAQRRRAALSPARPATARWGWIGAAATVGALVVALQLRPPSAPPEAPPHAVVAAPALPADPGGVLVEDPDFYLWLASRESQALAME